LENTSGYPESTISLSDGYFFLIALQTAVAAIDLPIPPFTEKITFFMIIF
jgi:hypothetical protein